MDLMIKSKVFVTFELSHPKKAGEMWDGTIKIFRNIENSQLSLIKFNPQSYIKPIR